jgi:hypothetical protein
VLLGGCPGEILGCAHAISDAAPVPGIAETEADGTGIANEKRGEYESISRFVELKTCAIVIKFSWSIVTLGARRPMPMEVAKIISRNDADLQSD